MAEPEPEPDNEPLEESNHIPNISIIPINIFNFVNRFMNQSNSIEEQVIQQSFNEQPKYKKICSKYFINSLSIQKVDQEMIDKELTCSICLEPLVLDENVIELPCDDKHYFHIKKNNCEGIYPWLKQNNTCPMCRYQFPFEEVKIEEETTDESTDETTDETTNGISINPQLLHSLLLDTLHQEEERMLQEAYYNSYHNQ